MSKDLAIPSSKDVVKALEPAVLYQLECAGELAREVLDERIAEWVEEGWTQRKIAGALGCSQSSMDRRLMRLGLRTKDPRGGTRTLTQGGSKQDDDEVYVPEDETEIVRNDPAPPARAVKPKRPPLFVITASTEWEDDIDSMTPRECEKQLVAVREALEFFQKLEEALIPKGTPLKSVR